MPRSQDPKSNTEKTFKGLNKDLDALNKTIQTLGSPTAHSSAASVKPSLDPLANSALAAASPVSTAVGSMKLVYSPPAAPIAPLQPAAIEESFKRVYADLTKSVPNLKDVMPEADLRNIIATNASVYQDFQFTGADGKLTQDGKKMIEVFEDSIKAVVEEAAKDFRESSRNAAVSEVKALFEAYEEQKSKEDILAQSPVKSVENQRDLEAAYMSKRTLCNQAFELAATKVEDGNLPFRTRHEIAEAAYAAVKKDGVTRDLVKAYIKGEVRPRADLADIFSNLAKIEKKRPSRIQHFASWFANKFKSALRTSSKDRATALDKGGSVDKWKNQQLRNMDEKNLQFVEDIKDLVGRHCGSESRKALTGELDKLVNGIEKSDLAVKAQALSHSLTINQTILTEVVTLGIKMKRAKEMLRQFISKQDPDKQLQFSPVPDELRQYFPKDFFKDLAAQNSGQSKTEYQIITELSALIDNSKAEQWETVDSCVEEIQNVTRRINDKVTALATGVTNRKKRAESLEKGMRMQKGALDVLTKDAAQRRNEAYNKASEKVVGAYKSADEVIKTSKAKAQADYEASIARRLAGQSTVGSLSGRNITPNNAGGNRNDKGGINH